MFIGGLSLVSHNIVGGIGITCPVNIVGVAGYDALSVALEVIRTASKSPC